MIDYSLLDFLENILNESYLVVDVDFLGDGNGDGVSNWGGDLNVVQNLLNVDLSGKLNGHLFSVSGVGANGSENLLLGDNWLTETDGTTESGLQDVRSVTSDDRSVFVVNLGVDDLGGSLVDSGNWGGLVDDLLDCVLHNRGRLDGGVLQNWANVGGNLNGFGKSVSDWGRCGNVDGLSNSVAHNWGWSRDNWGGKRSRDGSGEIVSDRGRGSGNVDGLSNGVAHNGCRCGNDGSVKRSGNGLRKIVSDGIRSGHFDGGRIGHQCGSGSSSVGHSHTIDCARQGL